MNKEPDCCEDCNRIRVTPITITDAEWDAIGTGWVKSGGHKKWLSWVKFAPAEEMFC